MNNTSVALNFGSHYSTNGVSLYNNTDSETTVSVYNCYYFLASDASGGYTYTGSLTFNSCIVESVASISAPTADGDTEFNYDGQSKTFGFTYDSPTISTYNTVNYITALKNIDTTVEAVDLYNNTINSSDYNLDTTTVNGTLVATKAGTYTVKFNLKQSAVDADIRWSGGAGEKTIVFTIKPVTVTVPVAPAAKEYSGSAQTFALMYFNATNIKTDSITSTVSANASAVTDADGNAWTDTTGSFNATYVDQYTVTFKLRDEDNYVWGDETGGNGTRTAKFEITQKELGLTFTCSSLKSNKAVWEAGETATITVTDGRLATDNLSLIFYYDDISKNLTGATTGNSTAITMPTNISVGKHSLYVDLNGSTGDNANYKLPAKNYYEFEVTSSTASTDFDWTYSENGTEKGDITDGTELKYKLNTEYSVAVVIPDDQDYIEVTGYTNEKGSTVDTYTTTVSLKSNDSTKLFDDGDGNKSATTTLTFNWKIVQGDIDLSGVKWEYSTDNGNEWKEYSSAVDYNDGLSIKIRVKATSLPQGFKLASTYSGDSKKEVGPYTITVNKAYYEYDTVNFKAPAELTLNFEIKAKNLFTQWKPQVEDFTNDNGSGKFIAMVLSLSDKHANYVEYKYYDMDNGGAEVTLDDIKDSATMTDIRHYKVEAYIKTEHAGNYELSDGGATPSTTFETGSDKTIATATVDGKTEGITAVYSGNGLYGKDGLKVTGDDGQNLDFTVTYYKGEKPEDGNELEGLPTDAGDYVIKFALDASLEDDYVLMNEWIKVTILPKAIALPTVGEITFNNTFVDLTQYLGGSYTEYKDIAKIVPGEKYEGVKYAGAYRATLTITNPNYCWENSSEKSTAKALAKYALADDAADWTADGTVAYLNWKINPYVLKVSGWNLKGKDGAVYKIPGELTDGLDIDINYLYYPDKASDHLGDGDVLKGGSTYFVKAQLLGTGAENFVFENETTISDFASYTVPQSGAAAALGVLKGFMNKIMLGLPMWAWLLIGLAVLILLIIIIAVCVKRRKTKEQREEIKARKEEERQRREDERRIQQEKMQAERELAMAKQQAELEKIRMQSGMAGAGMASMAMQAMPTQPQTQQPAQQAMPAQTMQAPADGSVLAEIKAELAEIKARQNMGAGYQQAAAFANDPVAAAELIRLKAENEAHMRAELERARSEAERARMEAELARVRAESRYAYPPQQFDGNALGGDMQKIGALAVAIWQSMNKTAEPAEVKAPEVPQITEESASASAMYPPDAVITTTTTVDTTQKPLRRERGESSGNPEFSDLDGFYDAYNE